jgi:hypothetical protein
VGAQRKIELIDEPANCLGRPVDLVNLSTVGEPPLGQILSGGVRILGSNSHYGALISKHLFDAAVFLPYRNRILATRRQAWFEK